MATAAIRVLDTAELAETILLYLPLRDLLLSQGVCRTWQNVHSGSQKIKVALFLEPHSNDNLSFQRIILRAQSGRMEVKEGWVTSTTSSWAQHNPILNPFLNVFVHEEGMRNENNLWLHLMSDSFVSGIDTDNGYPLHPAPEWLADFHNEPTSSWHRMAFTQPAPSELFVYCSRKNSYFNSAGNCAAVASKGVRVGTVHELLYNHLKHCVNCPRLGQEASQWHWHGDGDTDVVDLDITGWEMLEELKKRSTI